MAAYDGTGEPVAPATGLEVTAEQVFPPEVIRAAAAVTGRGTGTERGAITYMRAHSYAKQRAYAIATIVMFAGFGAMAAEPLFNGDPTRALLIVMAAVGMAFGFVVGSFTERAHWSTGVVVWNTAALVAGSGLGWLYFRRLDGIDPSDPRIQRGLGVAFGLVAVSYIVRWVLRRRHNKRRFNM